MITITRNEEVVLNQIKIFDMEYPDPSLATGIGLFVDLYNISTFFHGSIREWRAYFPEPESKKLEGYPIEPVGHRKITNDYDWRSQNGYFRC